MSLKVDNSERSGNSERSDNSERSNNSERSDILWRFACGNVFNNFDNSLHFSLLFPFFENVWQKCSSVKVCENVKE